MSKWIDAEWIRNIYADFEHYENRDDWTTPITNVLAVIDDAPSIDIEPKRGEWVETSEGTMCSNCYKFPYDDGEYHIANWHSDFCPNCGSDMRKGADDE